MKKIISIFLAVVILCPVFAFSVSANENTGFENRLELLKAWGIVESATEALEEELFTPDAAIKIFEKIGIKTPAFYGDSVTADDMIEALMDMLGYGPVMKLSGGDKEDYLKRAAELGIIRGVTLGKTITWGQAVTLIHNALYTEAVKENYSGGYVISDEIYLEEVLKIYKGYGLVYASGEAALADSYAVRKGHTRIGDEIYYSEGVYTDELLGCMVTYYYRENDDGDVYTLLYAQIKSSEKSVIIDAEDIIAYNSKKYTYALNGRTKTVSFKPDAYVVYNYRAASTYTDSMMRPTSGTVMLNDTDGDGKYDVVNVISYRYIAVVKIDKYAKRIYDKNSTTNFFDYDDDTIFKYQDGTVAQIDDIAVGNVLSITENGEHKTVIISDDSISGTVASVITDDGTWIKINDNKIKVDSSFSGTMPRLKDSIMIYLNHKSQIVFFEKISEKGNFGYIIKVWQKSDDYVYVKFFDANAADILTYKVAEKIKIDGNQRKKPEEVLGDLTSAGQTIYQLMAYKINEEKEITYIDTSYNQTDNMGALPTSKETKDTLHISYSSYAEGMLQRLHVKAFNGYFMLAGKAILKDGHSIIMQVPDDSMMDTASKKDFGVVSNLYNELTHDELSDKLEIYSLSEESFVSDVGIIYEAPDTLDVAGGNHVGIISKITYGLNDDDEVVSKINIFHDGKEKTLDSIGGETFPTEDGTHMYTLQKGDVIRVNPSAFEEGEILSAQIIARIIDGQPVYMGNTERKQSLALTEMGDYSAPMSSIMAEIVDMESELMMVQPIRTSDTQNIDAYIAHNYGSRGIYVCDTGEQNKISVGTYDDIVTREDAGDLCSKLLICNSWAIPYCIVIYK